MLKKKLKYNMSENVKLDMFPGDKTHHPNFVSMEKLCVLLAGMTLYNKEKWSRKDRKHMLCLPFSSLHFYLYCYINFNRNVWCE